VQFIPPMTLTAFRVGLAGLVLVIAWMLWEGAGPVLRAPWLRGIGVGFVVMGLGAVLVAVALERTDPVTVAIITAMMPVIGIALECLLDGRRLTVALVAGLILSLAGLLATNLASLLHSGVHDFLYSGLRRILLIAGFHRDHVYRVDHGHIGATDGDDGSSCART
jgi:drug/metabolite transporter (DMT)-like permease